MSMTTTLLWMWVVAIFVAYLYQFRPIMGAILDTLGL